jgi:hypothetical protein
LPILSSFAWLARDYQSYLTYQSTNAIPPLGHLPKICTIIRIKVLKVIVLHAHLFDRKNADAITLKGGFILWFVVLALWDKGFGCPNFQHQMFYTRISTWC